MTKSVPRPTSEKTAESLDHVEVVAYDAEWPRLFQAERVLLLAQIGSVLSELEHVGSTAVPDLRAKPIIDMMAAVPTLQAADASMRKLDALGYELIDTGMADRLFFRKILPSGQLYQLHVVEKKTWDDRHERLMRDYLRTHAETAVAYGKLKDELAVTFVEDSLGYTQAKTAFVQYVVDLARAERGLPPINVWAD